MVRNYKIKTDRQTWNKQSMDSAVSAVIEGKMGYRKASLNYKVPKTTLEQYVNKMKNNCDKVLEVAKPGAFKAVFTEEQEKELYEYVVNMEQRLFGLTSAELRSLAFQLAERNNFNNPFNKETKLAGIDWLNGFMQRHPNISYRKPEATSAARAMGFNKVSVGKYFDLLNNIVETTNITAERVYNVDETGVTINPKHHSRILAQKGRRQVETVTSAERGETVTAVVCVSAAETYMPPMLIFPRKRMREEFETGLSPGSWAEVHPSGWINKSLFLSWFNKFIDFAKPSKTSPVLLLFDRHKSHTTNLDVIDLAREKGVILLCFPPHCSHRLQPLDVSFFRPLSKYYEDAVRRWLRNHPGKIVTLFHIAALFGEAFIQSANMLTAINGFKKSGAWPVNMNVFTEADFLPADPTDIDLSENKENDYIQNHAKEENCPEMLIMDTIQPDKLVDQPGTSTDQPETSTDQPETSTDCNVSTFATCSPLIIQPLPKVTQGKKRVSRNRGKAAILTSSPYKAQLMEAVEKINKKDLCKKRLKVSECDAQKKKMPKRISITRKTQQKRRTYKKENKSSDSSFKGSTSDDAQCLYCHDLYSTSNEGWISCSVCLRWAHNSCAGVDEDNDDDGHSFLCLLFLK